MAAQPSATSIPLLQRPLIDPSWTRAPNDRFHPTKPSHLLSHLGSTAAYRQAQDDIVDDADESDGSSVWSYTEETELVTLDLGTDRTARKALLGLSGGASLSEPRLPSSGGPGSSSRSVRSAANKAVATDTTARKEQKRGTAADDTSTSTAAAPSRSVVGAGRMFSITGLDTTSPLLKVGNTILRGQRTELLGSEIVLKDEYDASRPLGQQHALQPLRPVETSSAFNAASASTPASTTFDSFTQQRQQSDRHPTTQSSTTSSRLHFVPIYDPTDNERLPLDVRRGALTEDLAALAQSTATTRAKGKGKGKEKATTTTERGGKRGEVGSADDDTPLAQRAQAETAEAEAATHTSRQRRETRKEVELTEAEILLRKAEKSVRKEVRRRKREELKAQEQEQQQQQQEQEQAGKGQSRQRHEASTSTKEAATIAAPAGDRSGQEVQQQRRQQLRDETARQAETEERGDAMEED